MKINLYKNYTMDVTIDDLQVILYCLKKEITRAKNDGNIIEYIKKLEGHCKIITDALNL